MPIHKNFLKRVFSFLALRSVAIVLTIALSLGLSFSLSSCATSNTNVLIDLVGLAGKEEPKDLVSLQEVATPALIQALHAELDRYQPQVKITAPTPGEVINQTIINVSLTVEDYPLFKNPEFAMGPHVHLFLDDQPYTAIYSTEEPVVLTDVSPGTHTLRAFASRPWHESFKNEGAYAQVTFHVLTETGNNAPDPQQPLLTYSRPQGGYGAEPIMLDFYLTKAPLHFLASEPKDDISDWRIRATINGESFLIDRWEPIYLSGFAEGDNWVKLEFLGEEGEPLPNAFNTTARVVNYTPGGQDGLSRIVRGDVTLEEALAIVRPPSTAAPAVETTPAPITEPAPPAHQPAAPESVSEPEEKASESTPETGTESVEESSETLENTPDNSPQNTLETGETGTETASQEANPPEPTEPEAL